MPNKEKLSFKTSSGIKNIIGRDLITDKYVAIFELVKNSYDAQATEVIVSLNTNTEAHNIIIKDNGLGMNKDDLIHKWLFLAYSEKSEGHSHNKPVNEKHNFAERSYVGSKGIGRFSCDNLGENLIIRTKKNGEHIVNILEINWTDFEQSLSVKFENIKVEYYSEACRKSEINTSFTELTISNLREKWEVKDSLLKVRSSLTRLKNPFIKDDGFKIYWGENIINNLIQDEKDLVCSNIAEVLKNKSITISSSITTHEIKIELTDRGNKIFEIRKNNFDAEQRKPVSFNGVESIYFEINYLTTSSKATFTRRMGIPPVSYGNIFIYKNNFRVHPYGEITFDFLGLNLRKTQGYSRYIGTREILGYIAISDKYNHFKEASSRDHGFIKNHYYHELESFYLEFIHKPLEHYIHLVKWGESAETKEEILYSSLNDDDKQKYKNRLSRNDFDLVYFNESVNFEENKPEVKLERITPILPVKEQKIIKEVAKQVHELKNITHEQEKVISKKSEEIVKKIQDISALERQTSNLLQKRHPDQFAEQITHHLQMISEKLFFQSKAFKKLADSLESESIKKRLLKEIENLNTTSKELSVFKDLLLKTSIDTRSSQKINWYEMAVWHFNNKNQSRIKVMCHAADNITNHMQINTDSISYIMMLDNFYINAIDHKATYIDFLFDKNGISITSNSTPIDIDKFDKIFERGYSTKDGGTGIGLSQIKDFLQDVDYDITVSNLNNCVSFRVQKRENHEA